MSSQENARPPEPRFSDSEDIRATDVTRLLQRWRSGDDRAQQQIFEAVYGDLKRLAGAAMRNERAGHTLPPTALVNEVFLRMEREGSARLIAENRRHFLAIAARAMRRILVEHARFHAAARRPSPRESRPLEDLESGQQPAIDHPLDAIEVLAVDQSLERLRNTNERAAQVVELRYFAGLEESEVANVLEVSRATVTRDWRLARLLLRSFIAGDRNAGSTPGTPDGS